MVPVAAASWAAAAFATLSPGAAAPAATGLWAATAVLLLLALRRGGRVRNGCAVAAIALAAAAAVCTHVAAAAPVREELSAVEMGGGRALTVEVRVVGKVETDARGFRFDGTLVSVRRGQDREGEKRFPGGVPVLVRVPAVASDLDLGALVKARGTAWPSEPGRRAVLVVDAAEQPTVIEPAAGPLAAAAALRRGLVDLTTSLPAPGGGLIAGLAVGDTSAVTPELDAAMKASSLSHLTAVSGANCALVVAGAFGLAAAVRLRRAVRVGAGLSALIAFVVLVTPEPSVVRAAAMAAIAMLGILLGRPGAGLSLLTTAVAILLVSDPWLSLSLGFALSSAATGALLVGAGPLADGLARWMPRALALGISVPLAAQLACGPLIVLIAPQLSVYGVAANLLAAPAAPVGTIVGLAACLTAGIPYLGTGLAALAWLPATWIAGTATTFAGLPGSVVAWPQGVGGLVALAVLGAAVAALVVPTRPRVRIAAAWTIAAAVGIGVALGPVADTVERTRLPTAWAIAACDIGQGDAVVVRAGRSIALIDTGPDPALLERCLARLDVSHIDLLVLTHFDLDHVGGVAAVRGRAGTVLHGPSSGPEDDRMIADLAAEGARPVQALRGMTGTLGPARWRILWPKPAIPGGNDASVVVEIEGGGVPASVYLGDLSQEGQRAMSTGAVLLDRYDVVKVAHHGSADQDPSFYARLRPAVALVSVGERNTYGHPRQETLAMLALVGAQTLRTDQGGLSVVWRDSEGLRRWQDRAPSAAPAPAPAVGSAG